MKIVIHKDQDINAFIKVLNDNGYEVHVDEQSGEGGEVILHPRPIKLIDYDQSIDDDIRDAVLNSDLNRTYDLEELRRILDIDDDGLKAATNLIVDRFNTLVEDINTLTLPPFGQEDHLSFTTFKLALIDLHTILEGLLEEVQIYGEIKYNEE